MSARDMNARIEAQMALDRTSTGAEAGLDAVVFSPTPNTPSTSIRSNRSANQSPVTGTPTGATNLGSDTSGATTGVSASYATVSGGDQNVAAQTLGVVAGGFQNVLTSGGGGACAIGGGEGNTINGADCAIAGGSGNSVQGTTGAFIGAGVSNVVIGGSGVVAGGQGNTSVGLFGVVCGGSANLAGDTFAVVGGGVDNVAAAPVSTIAGGDENFTATTFCAIGGGLNNTATGIGACVPGGSSNNAGTGVYAFVFADGVGGIIVQITGDVRFAFNDGDTVLIQPTETPLSLPTATIATVPAFDGTNTTFNLAAPIGGIATGGRIADVSLGANSRAGGHLAQAVRPGQDAWASGSDGTTPGNVQTSVMVLTGTTPGVGAGESVELLLDGGPLTLEDNKSYLLELQVAVNAVVGGVRKPGTILHATCAHRDSGTTVIDADSTTLSQAEAVVGGWTIAVTVGAAPDRVVVTFNTGADTALTTVACRVTMTEAFLLLPPT